MYRIQASTGHRVFDAAKYSPNAKTEQLSDDLYDLQMKIQKLVIEKSISQMIS